MRYWNLTAIFEMVTRRWFIEGIEYEYNADGDAEFSDVDTFGATDGYLTFEEADRALTFMACNTYRLHVSVSHQENRAMVTVR